LDLRQFAQGLFGSLTYGRLRNPGLFKERRSNAPLLLETSEQQMFHVHALMTSAHGM
jgi:hypothetical protein